MPYLNKNKKKDNISSIKRNIRQKVYNSTLWKKLRMAHLIEFPLCEECLKEKIIEPAIDVHHIISFVDNINLAYDTNNLMSLCKKCHQKKHNNNLNFK